MKAVERLKSLILNGFEGLEQKICAEFNTSASNR